MKTSGDTLLREGSRLTLHSPPPPPPHRGTPPLLMGGGKGGRGRVLADASVSSLMPQLSAQMMPLLHDQRRTQRFQGRRRRPRHWRLIPPLVGGGGAEHAGGGEREKRAACSAERIRDAGAPRRRTSRQMEGDPTFRAPRLHAGGPGFRDRQSTVNYLSRESVEPGMAASVTHPFRAPSSRCVCWPPAPANYLMGRHRQPRVN